MDLVLHHDRSPEVGLKNCLDPFEFGRSNADYGKRVTVQHQDFAYHGRVRPEALLPEGVAQDNHRALPGNLILLRQEPSAPEGSNTQ